MLKNVATATVVLKRFPKVDPVVENAIAMGVGGVAVLLISWIAGETWMVPGEPATILSLVYLVLGGSIWAQWPLSGLWAVGVLVGVDLLATGAALICLSLTIRALNKLVRGAVSTSLARHD